MNEEVEKLLTEVPAGEVVTKFRTTNISIISSESTTNINISYGILFFNY